jgi:L,D-peptidoglycan transpeptidase YkuD (ErfK/YbiS/YcfS/YnhG family)
MLLVKTHRAVLACRAACAGVVLALMAASAAGQSRSPLHDSRQLLLVVTDGWESMAGTLQRFGRATTADAWRPVGPPAPVVVGKKGLAWGRGENAAQATGPTKKEGDAKAPAGAFRLGTAFGQASRAPAGLRMPYLFLNDNVECVDDTRSTHYNQLLARSSAARPDWTSSEKMWAEPLYEWGVVVEHNARPVQPSAGSCIFLHIWSGPASGTAGCTAMDEADLTSLLEWLDAAKNPMLVQLPRDEHARLTTAWGLPPVELPLR